MHKLSINHKLRPAVTLLLAACLLLTACGSTEEADTTAAADSTSADDTIQIGFLFDNFVIERWEKDRDIFVSTAKELGADVYVSNANGDADEQAVLLERMVEDDMDVIVVVSIDSTTLVEPIEKAHRAGIEVISYDRIVNNADTDLYISFDNEVVGEYMAQCLNTNLPDGGDFIFVMGPDTDFNVSMVRTGFDRTIADNFTEIGSYNCDNWNDEEAYDYLSENLDLLQEAEAIVCGNDSIAGQAVRVLSENRLAGQVVVTGQDADLEACQRLVEGTQSMTVYKPIEMLAKKAAQEAVRIAKEEESLTNLRTFDDGSYEIPYIAFSPQMVTADNLEDTIIADGFYMEDDIYNH